MAHDLLVDDPTVWTAPPNGVRPAPVPPRRLRGLRMPVVPSGAWLAQVGGAAAALWGTYHEFGVGWAALVGGVASVVVGALREAGKI